MFHDFIFQNFVYAIIILHACLQIFLTTLNNGNKFYVYTLLFFYSTFFTVFNKPLKIVG